MNIFHDIWLQTPPSGNKTMHSLLGTETAQAALQSATKEDLAAIFAVLQDSVCETVFVELARAAREKSASLKLKEPPPKITALHVEMWRRLCEDLDHEYGPRVNHLPWWIPFKDSWKHLDRERRIQVLSEELREKPLPETKAISVWRFHDAPEHLQRIVERYGDERWLVFIPKHFGDHIPIWTENLDGQFDPEIFWLRTGDKIIVAS